jgi:hypothetical protein
MRWVYCAVEREWEAWRSFEWVLELARAVRAVNRTSAAIITQRVVRVLPWGYLRPPPERNYHTPIKLTSELKVFFGITLAYTVGATRFWRAMHVARPTRPVIRGGRGGIEPRAQARRVLSLYAGSILWIDWCGRPKRHTGCPHCGYFDADWLGYHRTRPREECLGNEGSLLVAPLTRDLAGR